MSRAVVTLALALAACVAADEPVLTSGPPLTTCAEVMARRFDQQLCDFDGVCTWPEPSDPGGTGCCTSFAVCAEGRLVIESMCADACGTCMDDSGCLPGRAWCEGSTCVACPEPAACPPCPPGTEPVMRNGCPSCTCAPPSACPDDNLCASPETCYPGQVCAEGCRPGDRACCANVCALPGCAEPAPLGCRMECPAELNCASCMATACTCAAGVWACTPVCSDVVGPCFLP